MHALLRNIHPKQHYEVNIVDGYGHIDGIIGKRACRDVWPHLLAFFEKHSDIPENCQLVLDQYMNAIEKLKLEHCSTIDKSREGYSGRLLHTLSSEANFSLPNVSHFG